MVIVAPDGQFASDIGQAVKHFFIQNSIAQRLLQGLDELLLLGFSRSYMVPFRLVVAGPFHGSPGCEIRLPCH